MDRFVKFKENFVECSQIIICPFRGKPLIVAGAVATQISFWVK